jgi:hypothetical protein
MQKTYIGFSRDHSGSMQLLAKNAARAYNSEVNAIKESASRENQDVIISVVKCGSGREGIVKREIVNSNISMLQPMAEHLYEAKANSTPLFDSVGELIEILSAVPDADNNDVAFLINVITDGEENSSRYWNGRKLGEKIRELQATDRWTFVFRVPHGYGRKLASFGIPEGNILEWEQTQRGIEVASQHTQAAYGEYFKQRTMGVRSVKNFYSTDMSKVSVSQVKANLIDISNEIKLFAVQPNENGMMIRPFVESKLGSPMLKGAAFYQLSKPEKEVQSYKQICIVDKKSGAVYSGAGARDLLGLPHYGTVKIVPGNHGQYDIFIQSTSVNRKLIAGTQVLYWTKAGTTTF